MRLKIEILCCTQIITFFENEETGRGTGFLYRFGQTLALVSNRHVFAGRSPLTGCLQPGAVFTPNRIEFHVIIKNSKGYFLKPTSLGLINGGEAAWRELIGYEDGQNRMHLVDIAIYPLDNSGLTDKELKSDVAAFAAHMIINIDPETKEQSIKQGYPRVGNDVFILGYPKGLSQQGAVPVWKRGSVASEPLYHIMDGVPAFFVDGLTRDGMSGAPVLSYTGEITDEQGEALEGPESRRTEPWLVGVYAGRNGVTRDELNMTLGRVWSRSLLDELFFSGIPGRLEVDEAYFDFSSI